MSEPGFRDEDWMDLPREEGHNVISPPRVTNIPRATTTLTISLEEEEPEIPEASQLDLHSERKRYRVPVRHLNLLTFYPNPLDQK